MLQPSDFSEILEQFPSVEFAFSYGSGTIDQAGYDYGAHIEQTDLPMVDFFLVVQNSEEWHERNLKLNPSHYTPLIPLTAKRISRVQDDYGAGVWFNAMIPMRISRFPNRLMKYGVISMYRLLKDLNEWCDLYVAGRLHKPVRVLRQNEIISSAMNVNFENATKLAMLMLPERFRSARMFAAPMASESAFFMQVASISYSGDLRMIVGENPRKIENLVHGATMEYRRIYGNILKAQSSMIGCVLNVDETPAKIVYTQELSPVARWNLFKGLPKNVHTLLNWSPTSDYRNVPSTVRIMKAVTKLVRRSSTAQSVKGMLTSGALTSLIYLAEKVKKRFK